tara:strand:+ start:595 stop:1143 length:549 start_codon:yes stop_codon:yes gene_type:complete
MKTSKKLFKKMKSHQLLIVLALLVGGYFLYTYSKSKSGSLDSYSEINEAGAAASGAAANNYQPSHPAGENGDHAPAAGVSTDMHGLPPSCVKQNVTNPRELLPKDANSEFSKLNPMGSGDLESVSFLKAGTLNGIDTVGTSLRNANLQLRSEPANPRMNVGPWNNSTITADSNRRDLEIGTH